MHLANQKWNRKILFQCTLLVLIYFLSPWDVPLQFMLIHVFPECPSIDLSFSKTFLCSPKSYILFLRFPPIKLYKLSHFFIQSMVTLLILFKFRKGTFLGANIIQDAGAIIRTNIIPAVLESEKVIWATYHWFIISQCIPCQSLSVCF